MTSLLERIDLQHLEAAENCSCIRFVTDRKEHTSELQLLRHLVCRLLLEKKNMNNGAYAGPATDPSNEPTTQDILLCDGSMATGTGVTFFFKAQCRAAFNLLPMDNFANC